MATVNLGNIKLNWKGAYNAGTAYVIDDVVSYNGSSYVCIAATTGNLPTVTAKWNQMSAAGTDGTDVGTIITTQGDILYRDGSGLQRLAIGTAGQALLVNSGATAVEWGSGGKAVECHVYADENVGSVGSSGNFVSWDFTPTISGKVFLSHSGSHRMSTATHSYIEYLFNNGSGAVEQTTHGAGYPSSSSTHNQGFNFCGFATTNSNADSSTIMTVTAGTQCNFTVRHSGGGTANAAGDIGKDHIVSAIIFES